MKDMITAAHKKHFIKWFLEHYELKNPEAEWLLQYLSSNDELLDKVHFTDHFRNLPKALLMSTTCVQMTGFKFYKQKRVTSDVEKAFLDVHNHPEEDLYVTLYFRDRMNCPEYAFVLETVSDPQPRISTTEVIQSLQAELWLDFVSHQWLEGYLRREIDLALDGRDRNRFIELSARYRAFLKPEP